jgi:hypothetical protein
MIYNLKDFQIIQTEAVTTITTTTTTVQINQDSANPAVNPITIAAATEIRTNTESGTRPK